MLVKMTPELQRQHENMDVSQLFDATSRTERYETFKELFCYKMTDSSLMNTHVLKMIGYIEKLG
jgi:hypothetical protein